MLSAPTFELGIEEEGRVYKILDSVYKIVQNDDPVFYVETAFGEGLHFTSPPNFNCR